MVNDPKDQDVEMGGDDDEGSCNVASIPHEVVQQIRDHIMSYGVPEERANMFCCMRFHPNAKWGVQGVLFNKKPAWAIVCPADNGLVHIVAIFAEDFMSDMIDHMPQPSKYGKLN